jgi:hypothetical protein
MTRARAAGALSAGFALVAALSLARLGVLAPSDPRSARAALDEQPVAKFGLVA